MDQAVSTFNIDSIDGKSPFLTDTHHAWRDQLRRFIKAGRRWRR